MTSSIQQLSELIASSVDRLCKTYDTNKVKLPDLDGHFDPQEELALRDKTSGDVNLIVSAAMQLIATVSHPELTVYRIGNGHVKSAAIQTAIVANVPEILREAGPQGMHCNDIAKFTGIDGGKLGRILRLLVSSHVFREVRPNTFAHNRLSETLDTGKSVKEILSSPTTKHDNTPGFSALMELYSADYFKASAFMTDNLMDPTTGHSLETNATSVQRAFDIRVPYFNWLEQPDQIYRRKRFGAVIKGLGAVSGFWPPLILTGFDWASLPAASIVVDVGGALAYGGLIMDVAMQYPHLNFIVQTSRSFVEEGQKIWQDSGAEPFTSGRLKLQVHNIYSPQPQNNAAVFLLQFVFNYVPDLYAIKILSALRQAATNDTKLLISATMNRYACSDSELEKSTVSVTGSPIAPPPTSLAPQYMAERQSDFVYMHDIDAMNLNNGTERTFEAISQIVSQAGWRVTNVVQTDVGYDLIQAVTK